MTSENLLIPDGRSCHAVASRLASLSRPKPCAEAEALREGWLAKADPYEFAMYYDV
jgi:hypothetical protein